MALAEQVELVMGRYEVFIFQKSKVVNCWLNLRNALMHINKPRALLY